MAGTGRNFFYKRETVTVTAFPSAAQIQLPFRATHLIILLASKKEILNFSFKNPELDGELEPEDGPLVMDQLAIDKIWFKLDVAGSLSVRVWAWKI